MSKTVHFEVLPGASFNVATGFYEKGHPECMADFHFYRVTPGDRLEYDCTEYQYNLATYSEETEARLIYTYCYQEEENWAMYRGDFSEDGWRNTAFSFQESGWVRIAARRADGKTVTEEDCDAFGKNCCLVCEKEEYQAKEYFREEIELTADTVNEKKKEGNLVFGLMTDSHYVVNGRWEDSACNLNAVNDRVKFDAMIHLGDLTDGMVPLDITKEYVDGVMEDLQGLGIPVYLTLGNHDTNYFHGNPEWMTQEEASRYYLNQKDPWYYVDFEEQKLRCLFLYSFDHFQKIRYGFPAEEVAWVERVLSDTPEDFSVIVFAHVPLLAQMHFWSDRIRNSEGMKKAFDEYVQKGGMILGYVHGHNHADQVEYTENFPIIAVGCAKCEDFKDKKPEGSITYDRKMGTTSQELWDVMVIDTKGKKIDFVRFGAGEDRTVHAGGQYCCQTGEGRAVQNQGS